MAGINQGTPEVAVGEPLRLGDNGEYEIEHDPITDRLIVRDTVNGTEAYVRPETNDRIGNQGAFLRAMIDGKILADDGRLYSGLTDAERAANGWMFVPPGSWGSTPIDTDGLTIQGAGYGTYINGQNFPANLRVRADDVTIRGVRLNNYNGGTHNWHGINDWDDNSNHIGVGNLTVENVYFENFEAHGFRVAGQNHKILNCIFDSAVSHGAQARGLNTVITGCRFLTGIGVDAINLRDDDAIVANNTMFGPGGDGIAVYSNDHVIIGNRVHNAGANGITISNGTDVTIANNRVSGSANSDLNTSQGTNVNLDKNLTGAAN